MSEQPPAKCGPPNRIVLVRAHLRQALECVTPDGICSAITDALAELEQLEAEVNQLRRDKSDATWCAEAALRGAAKAPALSHDEWMAAEMAKQRAAAEAEASKWRPVYDELLNLLQQFVGHPDRFSARVDRSRGGPPELVVVGVHGNALRVPVADALALGLLDALAGDRATQMSAFVTALARLEIDHRFGEVKAP